MSTKTDLPSGGWVVLRDPASLSERQRRPITRLAGEFSSKDMNALTATDLDLAFEVNDALALALVESWSFGDAVTHDALLDLPGQAYPEVLSVVKPLFAQLSPDFSPDPTEGSPT